MDSLKEIAVKRIPKVLLLVVLGVLVAVSGAWGALALAYSWPLPGASAPRSL